MAASFCRSLSGIISVVLPIWFIEMVSGPCECQSNCRSIRQATPFLARPAPHPQRSIRSESEGRAMTIERCGPDSSNPASAANRLAARFAASCLAALMATGLAAVAPRSSYAASITRSAPPSPVTRLPSYVIDVAGKCVRIVGPRFYPNPTKALTFPGRERPGHPDGPR